ncbi:MAG: hypothetical protein EPN31_15605 [Castellaniella sp.]|uniref:hypothetical protein n=1 Tax=Castellaniella sp. TaxID=1955812 RepID=UPI00121113A1|nr:hypothetical protein [Castellaniella sp.]TAN25284.1 MAG: hypothetical protein EPN31_15605 [Castellaniella sp.]
MKSLVFSQKLRADGSYFLKIQDGVEGSDDVELNAVDARVDELEYLLIQKLKGAASKLAFTDLASHPLDVGAKIVVRVEPEYEFKDINASLIRFKDGERVDEGRELELDEEIPLLNRTTSEGESDGEHSVIGSLNIFAQAPENESVLEGHDFIELDNGLVTISVDTSDAESVVGGFGTPSVLGAWAVLQLFRESLEFHTGVEDIPEGDDDYVEEEEEEEFLEEENERWRF